MESTSWTEMSKGRIIVKKVENRKRTLFDCHAVLVI